MSNLEELNYAIISELRDQLEIKEREIKKMKNILKECREIFDECFSPSVKHGELYNKIDEVLK